MNEKFTIFRSQSPKLSQMNPELLKQEEKAKTTDELLKVITEAVTQLQDLLEEKQMTEEPKAKDLDLIAKSLESEGLNGHFVRVGRRVLS